jgi:hypothetical protein
MMISNSAADQVLWNDYPSKTVRCYEHSTGLQTTIPFTRGGDSLLCGGHGDVFVVQHRLTRDALTIAAYSFDHPTIPLATIEISDGAAAASLTGDGTVWEITGGVFLHRTTDKHGSGTNHRITRVDGGIATTGTPPWHSYPDYNLMYQGIVGVSESATSNELIVGIQRSNKLVICDRESLERIRTIELAGEQRGNPHPMGLSSTGDIWAMNYDTLSRLDGSALSVRQSLQIAFASAGGTGQFAGDMAFSPDGRTLAIARPFSADVAILETSDMSPIELFRVGSEPLQALILQDGTIASIGWKTNALTLTPASGYEE